MLSSQMLSGIPEVDLGIDEKIRNIEATDAAKRKAAEERLRRAKSGAPSAFVPSNLAVNFKHHNRFKPEIEERMIIDRVELKRNCALKAFDRWKQGYAFISVRRRLPTHHIYFDL